MDPWAITPAERTKHMDQFRSLNPSSAGFVTGEQAKALFLRSELPPPILGQIWTLADYTCDGKMDINEFSVACKLIQMKLKGFELPGVLPPSLKNVILGPQPQRQGSGHAILSPMNQGRPVPLPGYGLGLGITSPGRITSPSSAPMLPMPTPIFPTSFSISTPQIPFPSQQPMIPIVPIVPTQAQPVMGVQVQRSPSITSQDLVPSPPMKWAVPNQSRLKYTQQFNQNDRSKSGYLSGVQSRNILLGTGLPQPILAQVWALSDIEADGRLTCEEFILAMHLCDIARQTGRLPPKLPPDLIPPTLRGGNRRLSGGSSVHSSPSGSNISTGSNTPTPIEPEIVMSPSSAITFEDKRKVNFDRGQAELERRRKVLEDMAAREREERERKEREELEKIEKQRLEQERRKQEEFEQKLAIQREMEERRMEELRKHEEQKEAARKEMERQRQQEMEANKRQELLTRRQKEQDEVLRLKGVNHTLGLELSQLGELVRDLSTKITDTRQNVATVKSDIDVMRSKRDAIVNETNKYSSKVKEQSSRLIQSAQEKARLEKLVAENEVKRIQLKQLREKLQNKRAELGKKQSDANIIATELEELRVSLASLIESCKNLYVDYQDKRFQVLNLRKKHHGEFDSTSTWGAPIKRTWSIKNKPVYYRAMYDFEAANPDELGFSVGSIIQRDDNGAPDPGWLSGILDGRKGWFPESFVEVLPDGEIVPEPISVTSAPVTQASVKNIANSADAGAGEYYVAAYPYESAEPGDLCFEAGEMIYVYQAEGEWWTGSIGSDRSGIFPANFVTKLETENNNSNAAMSFEFNQDQGKGTKAELESYEEVQIKREISGFNNNMSNLEPSRSPKPTKTKKYEVATVLANYTGNGEGQISLTRGQLVTVRKQSASGWWEGEIQNNNKREIGWFPGSYVKLVGSGTGVSRQNSSRTTPTASDEFEMPGSVAPVFEEVKEQMIAIFPYTAQNTDELTFVKDDVITVLSKDEPDWWRGQLRDAIGLFPVNYVQSLSQAENRDGHFAIPETDESVWDGGPGTGTQEQQEEGAEEDENDNWDSNDDENDEEIMDQSFESANRVQGDTTKPFGLDYYEKNYSTSTIPLATPVDAVKSTNGVNVSSLERKRQEAISELMQTEEVYMNDMNIVESCFIGPLHRSGLLTNEELTTIFVNWLDLIDCSYKLLKAFIIRRKTCDNGVVLMIGDILCQHMPAMMTYIRFCSAQLRAASLIQQKCETSPEFVEFTKKCQADPRTQNLPLSSFLIKPMQRITRYPLLIKKILGSTPDNHPDRQNLEEALAKAEELCAQVNEGVREQENSDRLEWMQNHINCVGLDERLIFNSLTNSLGPRKFVHHGLLRKTKSGKELLGFLFNDFLLLAQPTRPMNLTQFSFDRNRHLKFKIYRKPIFLNELVLQEHDTLNEAEFVIGTGSRMYQMYVCAPGISEKRLWVRSINEAKKKYIQVQQQFLQKQRSKKTNSVGRLLVTVMEASNLCDKSKTGKSDPYCEVSLGSEVRRTTVMKETLNPKWHDSMQFSVKDLNEDILCLTVYDKDEFSPDQFLGRTEIAVSTIHEQTRNRKTPWTKTFSLLEIETGEVTIKIHLQIFEK